jgi:hypothetical protein
MGSSSLRADVSEIASFRRAPKIKKCGVEVYRAGTMSTKPSVEQSTAETLDTGVILSKQDLL